MLQGKVPGVRIASPSGRPGNSPSILLRGPTSLNASGRGLGPLIVVDDIVLSNGSPTDIPAGDIEYIEVVKGAAGASLYGARAANGVITIKTKRGLKGGQDGIEYTARMEYGMNNVEGDFGSAKSHQLFLDETGTNFCQNITGNTPCSSTFNWGQEILRVNNSPLDYSASPVAISGNVASSGNPALLRQRFQATTWPGRTYNPVRQTATNQPYLTANFGINGRIGRTSFYTALERFDQEGAFRGLEGFNRTSIRVNADFRASDRLNFTVSTLYSDSDQDVVGASFFRLTRVPAGTDILVKDTLGRRIVRTDLRTGGDQNENPLQTFENLQDSYTNSRFLGSMSAKWNALDWLDIEGNFSYDAFAGTELFIRPKGYRSTSAAPAPGVNGGQIYRQGDVATSYNGSFDIRGRKNLADDLKGVLGFRYIYDRQDTEGDTQNGLSLRVKDIWASNNATTNQAITSYQTSIVGIGYLLTGGLDYKDRYILDAAVRRDGSSLFGSENRWANFFRVGGTWRVSMEPFWGDGGVVSNFKLRGAYGSAGGRPTFSAQYETYNIGTGGIITLGQAGNSLLKPETTYELEVGADMEFFRKYGVEFTYVKANTHDQILTLPTPAALGFTTQWGNAGTLFNEGFELAVNVPILNQRNLFWGLRFTFDKFFTQITELNVPPFTFSAAGQQGTEGLFEYKEGERYGNMYGRQLMTSCADFDKYMKAAYKGQCGSGKAFQKDNNGWIVWVGDGNSYKDGISKNLWATTLPAANSPNGLAMNFGMPIVVRDTVTGAGIRRPVGNTMPDYRFGVTTDLTWKKFSFYALVDAAMGHQVFNEGKGWSLLDFQSQEGDMTNLSVEAAKPMGYYWRAGSPDNVGIGGLYDVLGANTWSVEDASYAKLREVTASYRIGRIAGAGDWQVGIIGRNLVTLTGYSGFDPEVGITGGVTGSGLVNGVDAFTFPNLRTLTMFFSTKF
jgi:TonB-linked SusC/RagA family outer membrane protein